MKYYLPLILFCLCGYITYGQASLPVNRSAWTTTPADWVDNGTGSYTSSFACSGSDMGRLDDTGDFYEINFDGVADTLRYALKGASFSGGTFKVQESDDGASWSDLDTYTSISGSCTDYAHGLSSTTRYIRFFYEIRSAGNVGLDDVIISDNSGGGTSGNCISEDFNSAPTAPAGWTFSGIGSYTSGSSSGVAPNSLKFDDTSDFIETPSVVSPLELSFWIKGNGTDASSALLVEGWDGSVWSTIENITNISTSETTKTYNSGLSGYTKFRLTYTKSAGNIAFDDMSVTCLTCTSPSTQVSTVSVSNVTTNSFDLSFDSGSGDGRLVVVSEEDAILSTPNSGVVYSANTVFGSGDDIGDGDYVVFRGSGNSVGISGLSAGSTYHIAVFEYSNTDECYNEVSPATTSQLTICAEPTVQVSSVGASASSGSVGLSWVAGDGSYSIVVFNVANSFSDPSDGVAYSATANYSGSGQQVVYSGSGSSVNIGGLNSSTAYYYRIYSYNACGGAPDYLSVAPLSGSVMTNTSNVPAGYYDLAWGNSCADLKGVLQGIIDSHTRYSYTPGVWNAFYTTDWRLNDAGTDTIVWDMYADNPSGAEPFEMTLGFDQTGSPTGTRTPEADGNTYDREHTFPSSWWGGGSSSSDTMYTDIHHLVPSNAVVNQQYKSNNPFGVVTSPTKTSLSGIKFGANTYGGTFTGTAIEPIDEYKGDLARITMYMATRYHDRIAGWETLTPEGDAVMNGTAYPAFEPWYIQMLMDWHRADPISEKELNRNDAVYDLQLNRNPFIDYPEFVDMVWGCDLYTGFDIVASAGCSAPVSAISTDGSVYTADMQCTDLAGWTHYWDSSSGKLLMSIELGANYIGHVGDGVFSLEVGGSSSVADVSGAPYVVNPNGFVAMGRYWRVNATYELRSSVNVRFYYDDTEYTALAGNGKTVLGSKSDMVAYVISGSGYSSSDLNPLNGHSGIGGGDYEELAWSTAVYGSGQNYAEFALSRIGGGGGLGGGGSGGGALSTGGIVTHTWNGALWSPSVPTASGYVVIDGDYDTYVEGSFEGVNLTVNSGMTLTVRGDSSVTISGDLTNDGAVLVLDTSSFVQTAMTVSNSGSGLYSMSREGNDYSGQYNYWSSPVGTATVGDVFGGTGKWFYSWDAVGNTWASENSSSVLEPGMGLIATGTSSTPTTIVRTFADSVGFNSGAIDYALGYNADGDVDNDWNLVGNPYPSGLDVVSFLNSNYNGGAGTIDNAVYLWNSDGSDYSSVDTDYAIMSTAGVTNSGGNIAPTSATVSSGQGFFVRALSGGNVTFSNTHRVATNNTFLRQKEDDWSRLWLTLTLDGKYSNEILVGIMPDAEDARDSYDAVKLDGHAKLALYSLMDNDRHEGRYAIQGIAPFEVERKIDLGIEAKQGGDFKLGISNDIGFGEDYRVYLYDNEKDSLFDIKRGAYGVELDEGVYEDRFSLRVVAKSAIRDIKDGTRVYASNRALHIQFMDSDMASARIGIYDLTGRMLFSGVNQEFLNVKVPVKVSGVYILRIENLFGVMTEKLFVK